MNAQSWRTTNRCLDPAVDGPTHGGAPECAIVAAIEVTALRPTQAHGDEPIGMVPHSLADNVRGALFIVRSTAIVPGRCKSARPEYREKCHSVLLAPSIPLGLRACSHTRQSGRPWEVSFRSPQMWESGSEKNGASSHRYDDVENASIRL